MYNKTMAIAVVKFIDWNLALGPKISYKTMLHMYVHNLKKELIPGGKTYMIK